MRRRSRWSRSTACCPTYPGLRAPRCCQRPALPSPRAAIPVCPSGQSAGAHLALMVAAFRSDVGCVVDEAGPTDAAALAGETAWDPTTGGQQDQGPRWVYNQMVAAFGQENLAWWSAA